MFVIVLLVIVVLGQLLVIARLTDRGTTKPKTEAMTASATTKSVAFHHGVNGTTFVNKPKQA